MTIPCLPGCDRSHDSGVVDCFVHAGVAAHVDGSFTVAAHRYDDTAVMDVNAHQADVVWVGSHTFTREQIVQLEAAISQAKGLLGWAVRDGRAA